MPTSMCVYQLCQGTDRLSASIAANDIPSGGGGGSDDSLNTPSIFPGSALNTPTPTTKRWRPINEWINCAARHKQCVSTYILIEKRK